MNLPTILRRQPNIFSEALNINYHNLSMWSQSSSLNSPKYIKIWKGHVNGTHMPNDNLDNFSELPD